MFVYESGTGNSGISFECRRQEFLFSVEGPEDAQITLELEEETEYEITGTE